MKCFMINRAVLSSDRPSEPLSCDLASASGAIPQTPLLSVSTLVQSGNTALEPESVPVPPARSQRRRGQRRRSRGRQVTILIVDDEEPVRETLVEVLSMEGYRVITAASVEQAEETKTRLGAEGIQLLITDVNLSPTAQLRAGYTLAQRWRALHPELPILLMSGDPSNEDLPEVRGGSLGFLLKPFQMDVLLEAVRRALGR
jgi:CheY-like chemotaxis protein